MVFTQYPYINVNDFNLDYILKRISLITNEVENFVSINAIKYADPIQWNITTQYEKNTIVIDPVTGTAYISVAPVPAGVALTRTEYWTVVFDLGMFVTKAAQNLTSRWESETTLTATFASNTGDWLVWGDVLYKALSNIIAGDQYVIGSNIAHFTIEDVYHEYLNEINDILTIVGDLVDLTTDDKTSIVNAINSVVTSLNNAVDSINATIGDLDDLDTSDKTSVVNAINEVNGKIIYLSPQMFGAKGDGVTDDTAAFAAMIDYAQDNIGYTRYDGTLNLYDYRKVHFMFAGVYAISDSVHFDRAYGLKLFKLNLIALPEFAANKPMLEIGDYFSAECILNGCSIDGNYVADTGILLSSSKLAMTIDNCSVSRFAHYGVNVPDTSGGNELIISNSKITQYRSRDRSNPDLPQFTTGIGVYIGSTQYDNLLSNVVISYCVEYTLYFHQNCSANLITGCHFYRGNVHDGHTNNYVNCEFDNTQLEFGGRGCVSNCIFQTAPDLAPFIRLYRANAQKWFYNYSSIVNNTFRSTDNQTPITDVITVDDTSYTIADASIDVQGNAFMYCTAMHNIASRGRIPYNYMYSNVFTNCDNTSGMFTINNVLIQYGTVTTNNEAVTFTTPFEYFYPIVLVDKAAAQATSVTRNGCTISNPNNESVKWFAIGRKGY